MGHLWSLITFVKSGKIVFSKRIEKFIIYEFSNLERLQKQIFQVTKRIPYMIILQCILMEAGEGLDLSTN